MDKESASNSADEMANKSNDDHLKTGDLPSHSPNGQANWQDSSGENPSHQGSINVDSSYPSNISPASSLQGSPQPSNSPVVEQVRMDDEEALVGQSSLQDVADNMSQCSIIPGLSSQPPEVLHEIDIGAGQSSSSDMIPNTNNHSARTERIVKLLPGSRSNDGSPANEEQPEWVIRDDFYDLDIFEPILEDSLRVVGEEEDGDYDDVDGDDDDGGHGGHDDDVDDVDDDDDDDVDVDADDVDDEDDESWINPLGSEPSDEETSETDDENANQRRINYDRSLPVKHNYLGNNLEELAGRQILDEQIPIRVPILEFPEFVLLPGQILPINSETFDELGHIEASLRRCFERGTRTFGMICASGASLGGHGTTAEIRSYSIDEDGNIKCILEGSQRFKIVSLERAGPLCSLYGLIMILPDFFLGSPYNLSCSLSRYSSSKQKNKIDRLRGLKYPVWVYNYFSADELIKRIRNQLKHWLIVHEDNNEQHEAHLNEPGTSGRQQNNSESRAKNRNESHNDLGGDNRNQLVDPRSFSYWVAANLPVDIKDRAKALTFDCVEARLLWELSLLEERVDLCCSFCNTTICSKDDVFSMSKTGPQTTFVNSHGYIHDTLTVYQAHLTKMVSDQWRDHYSWFPGYAWKVCHCKTCYRHIGWCFKTTNKSLKPHKFYGLSRKSIRLR